MISPPRSKPNRSAAALDSKPQAGVGQLEETSFLLGRAYYAYIGVLDRILREEGLAQHLRPGMGNVLFALFERDGMTISEVAARLRISKATMTGMVTRLRKAALITVRRDPTDGRAVRLTLTPLAKSLEGRCGQIARRVEDIISQKFRGDEAEVLKDLLTRVIDSLNEELGRVNSAAELPEQAGR